MGRLQLVMSSGTLMLGLYLVLVGGPEFAFFGWLVAVLGLAGLVAPVVLAGLSRPPGK